MKPASEQIAGFFVCFFSLLFQNTVGFLWVRIEKYERTPERRRLFSGVRCTTHKAKRQAWCVARYGRLMVRTII